MSKEADQYTEEILRDAINERLKKLLVIRNYRICSDTKTHLYWVEVEKSSSIESYFDFLNKKKFPTLIGALKEILNDIDPHYFNPPLIPDEIVVEEFSNERR